MESLWLLVASAGRYISFFHLSILHARGIIRASQAPFHLNASMLGVTRICFEKKLHEWRRSWLSTIDSRIWVANMAGSKRSVSQKVLEKMKCAGRFRVSL